MRTESVLSTDIPEDSPLKSLKISNIDIKIVRNKNYDMATKTNTFATYVSHRKKKTHKEKRV